MCLYVRTNIPVLYSRTERKRSKNDREGEQIRIPPARTFGKVIPWIHDSGIVEKK
jgi:hypothetical protein